MRGENEIREQSEHLSDIFCQRIEYIRNQYSPKVSETIGNDTLYSEGFHKGRLAGQYIALLWVLEDTNIEGGIDDDKD